MEWEQRQLTDAELAQEWWIPPRGWELRAFFGVVRGVLLFWLATTLLFAGAALVGWLVLPADLGTWWAVAGVVPIGMLGFVWFCATVYVVVTVPAQFREYAAPRRGEPLEARDREFVEVHVRVAEGVVYWGFDDVDGLLLRDVDGQAVWVADDVIFDVCELPDEGPVVLRGDEVILRVSERWTTLAATGTPVTLGSISSDEDEGRGAEQVEACDGVRLARVDRAPTSVAELAELLGKSERIVGKTTPGAG